MHTHARIHTHILKTLVPCNGVKIKKLMLRSIQITDFPEGGGADSAEHLVDLTIEAIVPYHSLLYSQIFYNKSVLIYKTDVYNWNIKYYHPHIIIQ